MIPDQWYVVLDSKQVKSRPVGVTRLGERLVFWRNHSGEVSCLRDLCVHRGVQLSAGKVVAGHLQCPFHGFEYDATGRVVRIPANGRNTPVPEAFRVQRYPTHEAHGFIWIWWGANPPDDLPPPAFFDDLDHRFTYAGVIDPWQAHYTRVIENQLDVVHLPFVHHNTIGRGGRTLVDGPLVQWVNENMFYFYVYNRVDDGTAPRRPRDMPPPDPERDFHLGFIFPNLWQNYIGTDARILAAFVPVDHDHTLLYLRFYQRFFRLPLLRRLFNRVAMPMNVYIAHQDRRVVETHLPEPGQLGGREQLIQGDLPIVEYRRRRAQLLAGTGQPPSET